MGLARTSTRHGPCRVHATRECALARRSLVERFAGGEVSQGHQELVERRLVDPIEPGPSVVWVTLGDDHANLAENLEIVEDHGVGEVEGLDGTRLRARVQPVVADKSDGGLRPEGARGGLNVHRDAR